MVKKLLIFGIVLGFILSAVSSLYAETDIAYVIYTVTQIGFTYEGETHPGSGTAPATVKSLGSSLKLKVGVTGYMGQDSIMYTGEIPDGTITGISLRITHYAEYDADNKIVDEEDIPAKEQWDELWTGSQVISGRMKLTLGYDGQTNKFSLTVEPL